MLRRAGETGTLAELHEDPHLPTPWQRNTFQRQRLDIYGALWASGAKARAPELRPCNINNSSADFETHFFHTKHKNIKKSLKILLCHNKSKQTKLLSNYFLCNEALNVGGARILRSLGKCLS